MRNATILGPILALTLLAGCAEETGQAPSGSGELEGGVWILDDASAATLGGSPSPGTRATISFDEGEVGGSAFCNHYGGTYEEEGGGTVSIEVGFMTEMACEEPLMTLESAFLGVLGEVDAYTVGQGTLILTRAGGEPLVFELERPLPLVGTAWRLDGIAAGADAVSSTIAGTEATAAFGTDGRIEGNAGCNDYGAGYAVDGGSIEIDEPERTDMLCEPDVMAQEATFLDALPEADSFEIRGQILTLFDAEGRFLLSFAGTSGAA